MIDPSTEPADIELAGPHAPLQIRWEDGHQSVYPLVYLRTLCPCAECTGHGSISEEERQARTFTPTQLTVREVQEVGNYGLSVLWADGHAFGIYSWRFLREIDPAQG